MGGYILPPPVQYKQCHFMHHFDYGPITRGGWLQPTMDLEHSLTKSGKEDFREKGRRGDPLPSIFAIYSPQAPHTSARQYQTN